MTNKQQKLRELINYLLHSCDSCTSGYLINSEDKEYQEDYKCSKCLGSGIYIPLEFGCELSNGSIVISNAPNIPVTLTQGFGLSDVSAKSNENRDISEKYWVYDGYKFCSQKTEKEIRETNKVLGIPPTLQEILFVIENYSSVSKSVQISSTGNFRWYEIDTCGEFLFNYDLTKPPLEQSEETLTEIINLLS